MGQIILLRHGQADLMGSDYDRLSTTGEEQARVTGAALARRGVVASVVVSGDLRRQSETARLARQAAGWTPALAVDPRLNEYDHTDVFGTVYPDMTSHAAISARIAESSNPRRAYQAMFETSFAAWLGGKRGPSGVSWSDFRERSVSAVRDLALRLGSGQVGVAVTSGGVIAAVCQELLGLPDSEVLKLHNPLQNASLTKLLTRGGEMSMASFNETGHLAETPELVTYR